MEIVGVIHFFAKATKCDKALLRVAKRGTSEKKCPVDSIHRPRVAEALAEAQARRSCLTELCFEGRFWYQQKALLRSPKGQHRRAKVEPEGIEPSS